MKNPCFKNACFCTWDKIKKVAAFCPSKDFIPTLQKSKNAYCLTCAVCNKNYIAKTDRNIVTHLNELGSRVDQPMYEHLLKC